jgi:hypothetical protein
VKEDSMGGVCSTHEEIRNAYNILIEKPEGKRPRERPRCKWEDNFRMNLRERRWEIVD